MESRSKNQKTTLYLPLELIFIFSLGVTGENIVVAILDDGLDMDSDDLKDNFASISTEKKNHRWDTVETDYGCFSSSPRVPTILMLEQRFQNRSLRTTDMERAAQVKSRQQGITFAAWALRTEPKSLVSEFYQRTSPTRTKPKRWTMLTSRIIFSLARGAPLTSAKLWRRRRRSYLTLSRME